MYSASLYVKLATFASSLAHTLPGAKAGFFDLADPLIEVCLAFRPVPPLSQLLLVLCSNLIKHGVGLQTTAAATQHGITNTVICYNVTVVTIQGIGFSDFGRNSGHLCQNPNQ